MAEKIWIVYGHTGEYSDHEKWAVDAWRTEQGARDRVEFLGQKIDEIGAEGCSDKGDGQADEEALKKMQEYDPNFSSLPSTGTGYFYEETMLKP